MTTTKNKQRQKPKPVENLALYSVTFEAIYRDVKDADGEGVEGGDDTKLVLAVSAEDAIAAVRESELGRRDREVDDDGEPTGKVSPVTVVSVNIHGVQRAKGMDLASANAIATLKEPA